MTMIAALPPRVIHALAGAADVDPCTVRRRLAGLPLRPSTAARIEAAAVTLKVTLPTLAAPSPSPSKP